MNLPLIRVIVLAAVADHSWRGEFTAPQLNDRAYSFTDLFLGQITYFEPSSRQTYGPGSQRVPVLGHLFALGEALLLGGSQSVGSFVNEWRLELEVDSKLVAIGVPSVGTITLETESFREEVAKTILDCCGLVLGACGRNQVPVFLNEAQALSGRLREAF
ncbi:MAG TPA: hypothetical protein PKD80_08475 [Microthrixaceae bacterium]|jgi:hypothetical protein|nr:hypothetical protein [Microthrixaceae bacterium]